MKKYIASIAFLAILTACSDCAEIKRNLVLDRALKHNNEIVDKGTEATIEAMEATSVEKPTLKPLPDLAKKLPGIIEPLIKAIAALRTDISNPGGIYLLKDEYHHESYESRKAKYEKEGFKKFIDTDNPALEAHPLSVSNKNTPAYILHGKAKLYALQKLCKETKETLFRELDDLYTLSVERPMRGVELETRDIDALKKRINELFPDSALLSLLFQDASIADCYPMLRKIESEAKNTIILIVNYLHKNMGNKVLVYDKYDVFSSSEKPYILLGETYEAEIALGAFSSQAEFTVSANGSPLRVEDGKAKFSARPGTVGTQSYRASITIVNPLTGETEKVDKEFKYEVGAPAISIENSAMNIFYMGVDNPISVAAAGVSSNDVDVRISGGGGGTLSKVANGKYIVKVSKQTSKDEFCNIDVWNKRNNKKMGTYVFRVKRVPDPVVKLAGENRATVLSPANMQKQRGLIAVFENFDFNGVCTVGKYNFLYIPKDGKSQEIVNEGGAFSAAAQALIAQAKPGDQYLFMDIVVRCPGDSAGRYMGSMGVVVE